MTKENYDQIIACLNKLRSEIAPVAQEISSQQQTDTDPTQDLISITAHRINSGLVNVYVDNEVNWEEVTLFDMDKIYHLLTLLDSQMIDAAADSISMSLDNKYDPDYPFFKPQVTSSYYQTTQTLPEEGDWDYRMRIIGLVKSIKEKREKAESFDNIRKTTNAKKQPVETAILEEECSRLRKENEELKAQIGQPETSSECLNVLIDGQAHKLNPTQKNRCYLLHLLAQKVFQNSSANEIPQLAFIIGTKPKTYDTTIRKIKNKGGYGNLNHEEKIIFGHLRDTYNLPNETEEPK